MSTEVPKQTAQERRRIQVLWGLTAVVTFCAAVVWLPYDMGRQSSILVRAEIHERIAGVRKTTGGWPENQGDSAFKYGPFALQEEQKPTFAYQSMTVDHGIEKATYEVTFRGEKASQTVSFDPNAKPKKRLF